jgi:HD-GYP domain-containing protein (c-di-GMP phosphodiesterase class II)
MVRISDLVRNQTATSVSKEESRADGSRLSNLTELVRYNATAVQAPLKETEPAASSEPAPAAPTLPEPKDPPSEPIPEQPAPPIPGKEASLTGKDHYLDAQAYLRDVRERLRRGEPFNLVRPAEIIKRMIADPALVDDMYLLSVTPKQEADILVTSPVNSMIYCFKIGVRRKFPPVDLVEICLAALLHDIGMWFIPDGILKKAGKLTDEEFAVIMKHTEKARDVLSRFDTLYSNVSRAVYEHHERENGQGYPRGIRGSEISEFAKIIGICDSYEAMTHDRGYKKTAEQYLSVLSLANSKDALFAPHIVKAFLDEITLYPTGSYVRLNSKAIGVVVQTNPKNPFKPIVRLIADGRGNRLQGGNAIDLAKDNILNIVGGIPVDDAPV